MMIDVNRRISQWDQKRIMGAVTAGGAGRTEIVSGKRPSRVVSRPSTFPDDDEAPRPSAEPRASATPGDPLPAADSGKTSTATPTAVTEGGGGGATLQPPSEHGQ